MAKDSKRPPDPRAKKLGIGGRSQMRKKELARAIARKQ